METLFIALRVLVVLGVMVALLWFVQRRVTKGRTSARRRRGNAVTVVGRQGVGPKASVVVVDVDGNRFVLGVTERQVSVLHTSDRPQDADVTPLVRVPEAAAEVQTEARTGTDDAPAITASSSTSTTTTTRQDADFLTAQGRASLFDEALKGSILSPATWRQASSAVRHKK
ncbi:flagellar biosynthetic protein FliO [Leifsonia xyli]|uniref:flagellar biosynthetic protein FliO n=1 Tax=Leifsonia xyli TaxID=1575 RepID=UPI0007CDC58B|nr:flagellar biosynthetic protein FliO [Leifsonia xyli]